MKLFREKSIRLARYQCSRSKQLTSLLGLTKKKNHPKLLVHVGYLIKKNVKFNFLHQVLNFCPVTRHTFPTDVGLLIRSRSLWHQGQLSELISVNSFDPKQLCHSSAEIGVFFSVGTVAYAEPIISSNQSKSLWRCQVTHLKAKTMKSKKTEMSNGFQLARYCQQTNRPVH